MNYKQAVKIAVEAIEKERRLHAVDANLFRLFGATGASQENSAKRVAELDEAKRILLGTPKLF